MDFAIMVAIMTHKLLVLVCHYSDRWEHLHLNNRCWCQIHSWISGSLARSHGERSHCGCCLWKDTSFRGWTYCLVPGLWLCNWTLVPKGTQKLYVTVHLKVLSYILAFLVGRLKWSFLAGRLLPLLLLSVILTVSLKFKFFLWLLFRKYWDSQE